MLAMMRRFLVECGKGAGGNNTFHSTARRRGLLKNINPLLGPDLLACLRAAGHGDVITCVDCNFPASSTALTTKSKRLIELAGVDLPTAVDAITSVLPLDFFVDKPAVYMAPSEGVSLPPLGREVHGHLQDVLQQNSGIPAAPLERFAFYEAAERSFVIVQCGGERRPYGNVMLQKGVIGPDGKDLKP